MKSSVPLYCFGDSYTLGNGAAPVSKSYAEIIKARFGCSIVNLAAGGTGVTRAVANAFSSLPSGGGKTITMMAGFNDLSRGSGEPTLQKIENETRAFLANAFLNSAVPANYASVVRTGTWTVATAGAWAQKASLGLGGGCLFNNGGGQLTWSFSGDSAVIGMWDTNGVTYTLSPVEIRVDGALVRTYNPQGQTDGNVDAYPQEQFMGLSHTVVVLTDLGSGAHTLELTGVGPQYTFVDYFGTLAAPGNCPQLLVGDVPHLNAAGLALLPLRSTARDDEASARIRLVVSEFAALGFPAYSIPVNNAYDPETMASTDNLHPGNAGHAAIARAFSVRVP